MIQPEDPRPRAVAEGSDVENDRLLAVAAAFCIAVQLVPAPVSMVSFSVPFPSLT